MGGSGRRGGLGGLATPLVVPCAGVMHRTLLLLPYLGSGSWVLAFLYLVLLNLPPLCMRAVIFSPLEFLCICCWRRWLSRCKHCSKGSQVPACLNTCLLKGISRIQLLKP